MEWLRLVMCFWNPFDLTLVRSYSFISTKFQQTVQHSIYQISVISRSAISDKRLYFNGNDAANYGRAGMDASALGINRGQATSKT
jgi:hypothetical protein